MSSSRRDHTLKMRLYKKVEATKWRGTANFLNCQLGLPSISLTFDLAISNFAQHVDFYIVRDNGALGWTFCSFHCEYQPYHYSSKKALGCNFIYLCQAVIFISQTSHHTLILRMILDDSFKACFLLQHMLIFTKDPSSSILPLPSQGQTFVPTGTTTATTTHPLGGTPSTSSTATSTAIPVDWSSVVTSNFPGPPALNQGTNVTFSNMTALNQTFSNITTIIPRSLFGRLLHGRGPPLPAVVDWRSRWGLNWITTIQVRMSIPLFHFSRALIFTHGGKAS